MGLIMADWKSRITEGAIETPDNIRYVFQYGDLEREIEKKTSTHTFGGIDGALVQDFGVGAISYPIIIYFTGKDYDRESTRFERSASKPGVCVLEHPIYGTKNVIIEKIKRQDAVRTAGNQAIFNLTITETLIIELPVSDANRGLGILDALEELAAAGANAFNNSFLGRTASALINAAARIQGAINDIAGAIDFISSTVDSITGAVNDISRYITNNMSTLLEAPLTLAGSIQRLIAAPSQAIASVQQRFAMYQDLYSELHDAITGNNSNDAKNQCAEQELYASATIGALCASALYADTDGIGFKTRADATGLAQSLIDLYTSIQGDIDALQDGTEDAALENQFAANDELAKAIKKAVSLTVQYLVTQAFSLKQEHITTLLYDRNILDVCYELYGTTENATLDMFIDSNSLTDDEIIMLPAGREIRYYA
jgi:prophage DNA circulation protein